MKASNRFISEGFVEETPSGTVNGSNVTFTLSFTPDDSAGVNVYLNGILQRLTTNYTISGATLTFVSAPALAQDVFVKYTKKT
jgi:hypothetical protein